MRPLRGRIYMADLGLGHGTKPFVIVSNNGRNQALPTCLGVRVTTSAKPRMHTIAELAPDDPIVGRALCDDIEILDAHELVKDVGALTLRTMTRIDLGLRHALGLG
jgi:mRNA interferase MazF